MNSLNEICLKILTDKQTNQILNDEKGLILINHISNMKNFDYDIVDHKKLINLIIKMHVYHQIVSSNDSIINSKYNESVNFYSKTIFF